MRWLIRGLLLPGGEVVDLVRPLFLLHLLLRRRHRLSPILQPETSGIGRRAWHGGHWGEVR